MPTAKTIGQLSAAASVTTTDQLAAENAAGSANSKYTIAQLRGWDYDSGNQTITLSSQLTLAHSLGAAPRSVLATLVNLTTEGNWAAGDEILLPDQAGSTRGVAIGWDATSIFVVFGNAILGLNKTTSGSFTLTAANWALRIRANA